jgi:predicted acylesterase/phospholipase RssA
MAKSTISNLPTTAVRDHVAPNTPLSERPLVRKSRAASGSLPPGFPTVEIDGERYWDGGLVSPVGAEK